jgi:UDP-N-acetylmuramoyl-L-alanyl-D-glutamate--2,6-diaminopimelate ligase
MMERARQMQIASRLFGVLQGNDAAHVDPVVGLISQGARLVTDSRLVKEGDTFLAYPGERSDGRGHIAKAIAQGAQAVIYEKENFAWDERWNVPGLAVTDLRHKAGLIADAAYGSPSENLWMVGVTGTNGKTSTCHWIAQSLCKAGKKCALIGTLGNGFKGALQPSINTTPDVVLLHGLLAEYLGQGASAVAMEVSSHALMQGRVNGVRFDVALLTNLSRDHLDYHGDMESYAAAKRRLFDWETLKHAVVNLDDAFGAEMALQLLEGKVEVIGYGLTDEALHLAERHGMRMVYGKLLHMSTDGLRMEIYSSWGMGEMKSGMLGRFNAANLLGVLGVLLLSDVSLADALNALSSVDPATGRMQRMGGAGQPAVIVDYAHTPDALEKVLAALREMGVGGKLYCVFGCGGDRDRGKRAMMGRIAEKFADRSIVTSDNPRGEDPSAIIGEVVSGMTMTNHEVIVDRASAIQYAIGRAKADDAILIAGKGHEDYQEIKGARLPYSDVEVALAALNSWKADGGMQ